MKDTNLGLTIKETAFAHQNKGQSPALRVLQWFAANGPATVYECELVLGAMTASPRMSRLIASNCLYATGERRKTRGTSTAAVYAYREGSSFIAYLGLQPSVKRITQTTQLTSTDRKILEAGKHFVKGIQQNPAGANMKRLSVYLHEKLVRVADLSTTPGTKP